MDELLDALRIYNIAGCVAVASLSGLALLRGWFPPRSSYLRFLRLGQIGLVLTIAYGTVRNWTHGLRPSETTAFFAVFLTWSLIGAVWTLAAEPRRHKRDISRKEAQ